MPLKNILEFFLSEILLNPECPCYSMKCLGHKFRSIQTYTQTIRLPLSQRLVSESGGINTPHTPFSLSLSLSLSLAHFKLNSLESLERALSLPLFYS